MSDFRVKLIDFPTTKIKACITPNEDGTHTIFVNSRLSTYQQAKAVQHELKHYYKDDFDKLDVNDIENNI
ncbi:MAG: ImmA/IrrE family metallo-endopeptidase [Lachnospiraceae bacterium]|nr:ImmA/IrrE family metallo-endopeptidase [Lachnospiraceae bacterium]